MERIRGAARIGNLLDITDSLGASRTPYTTRENRMYTETCEGTTGTYENRSLWSSTDTFAAGHASSSVKNRRPTAAIFLQGLIVCFLLVLCSSYLMIEKRGEQSADSMANAVRIITTGAVIFSLIAMVIFSCKIENRDLDISPPIIIGCKIFVLLIHSVFGVAGLVVKIIYLHDRPGTWDFTSYLTIVFYASICVLFIAQSFFIWYYRRWKCLKWRVSAPIGILVATDLGIGVVASFSFAEAATGDSGTGKHAAPAHAENGTIVMCVDAEFQSEEVVDRLNPVFVFGFCLLAVGMVSEIWNEWPNSDTTRPRNQQRGQRRERFQSTIGTVRLSAKLCTVLKLTLIFACRHVIVWFGGLCLGVLAFHIIAMDRDLLFLDVHCIKCVLSNSTTHLQNIDFVVSTIFYYAFCSLSVIGFILTVKSASTKIIYSSDAVLLLVSGCGQLTVVLFQIVDVGTGLDIGSHDLSAKVTFLLKSTFHVINLLCQTYMILKYQRNAQALAPSTGRMEFYIRSIVASLIVSNADRWFRVLAFSPSAAEYVKEMTFGDTFGSANWCQISKLLVPLDAFYRLQSTILCYDIYQSSR